MSFPGAAGFMLFMSFMVELFLVCEKGARLGFELRECVHCS